MRQEGRIFAQSAPAKARHAMLVGVGSHVSAHLRATHFKHISVIPDRARNQIHGFTKGEETPHGFRILAEIPTYVVALKHLSQWGLRRANRAEWVFVAEWTRHLVGKASVQRNGRRWVMVSLATGTEPIKLKRFASSIQRRMPTRLLGHVQLRILQVPGLYFSALWCHFPKAQRRDFFIPILRNFMGLREGRMYSRKQATPILKDSARRRLDFHHHVKEPGLAKLEQ